MTRVARARAPVFLVHVGGQPDDKFARGVCAVRLQLTTRGGQRVGRGTCRERRLAENENKKTATGT